MELFVAYPSEPQQLGAAIESAAERGNIAGWSLTPWAELSVAGRLIANEVLDKIADADAVAADVSLLNFNVTFEIGYAIAISKPILLLRNPAVSEDEAGRRAVGIFDTIGYETYQNSDDLRALLRRVLSDLKPLDIPKDLSSKAPAYIVLPRYRTEFITNIVSRLKQAKILFRSFDAAEFPRLSAQEAIEDVARSYGIIVPLEPPTVTDSAAHNLRGAFVAGLAYGLDKAVSILQNGEVPVPIDVRDFATHVMHPTQIAEEIQAFAADVIDAMQRASELQISEPETLLQRLNIGASSAENEFRDLSQYYLKTDSFLRAARGEARLVTGRKGSGKTAIFFQVRDSVWGDKDNVVLDLKPDGYKLLKFRESISALISAGSFEHTVMVIWEYVLLLEICHKILENDRQLHTRDHRLYEPYRKLHDLYRQEGYDTEGDFNERMSQLLLRVANDYGAAVSEGDERKSLRSADITNLIFKRDIRPLRNAIDEYLEFKDSVWILIDNLDKGWPTHGVQANDLVIIRALLEASRKLERQLGRFGVDCHTIVFLRNDVYELLIDQTPDRGKESRVTTDWTDRETFREMLRRRIVYSNFPPDTPFQEMWPRICVSHFRGEESSEYLINRSLMRPRYFLNLVMHCRGVAVNRGHEKIEVEDIEQALKTHSTSLLTEVGLEMRDVHPGYDDALYAFIALPPTLTAQEVAEALNNSIDIRESEVEPYIDLLMWFGFLGITSGDGEEKYIYDYQYDMNLLRHVVVSRAKASELQYCVNPAFHAALEVEQL